MHSIHEKKNKMFLYAALSGVPRPHRDVDRSHATPDKVKAIEEANLPWTVLQVRSFLDLINYYCKFLLGYVTVVKHLNEFLHKEHP